VTLINFVHLSVARSMLLFLLSSCTDWDNCNLWLMFDLSTTSWLYHGAVVDGRVNPRSWTQCCPVLSSSDCKLRRFEFSWVEQIVSPSIYRSYGIYFFRVDCIHAGLIAPNFLINWWTRSRCRSFCAGSFSSGILRASRTLEEIPPRTQHHRATAPQWVPTVMELSRQMSSS